MVAKVNGKAMAGEFLGGNLDFYTVALTLTGADAAAISAIVGKCVETISLNGQPIMLSGSALTATVTGAAQFKFAIEHTGSWGADAQTGASLVADRATAAETDLATKLGAISGVSAITVTLVDVL